MGKIWLQKTNGALIHLPVVGADVNTPDSAVKISVSAVSSVNRCWSNQIVVNHPTYGQFTIDLRPPGIVGSCNQCGQCCSHPLANCPDLGGECGYILHPDLNIHVCQHLTINKWRKWGDPDNTSCSIYASILDSSKGCAYPPDADEIMPWWTSCGFSEDTG
jgi:hypothetical protein